MGDAGDATEVDAEALNSENVYWIDYRKDRHFIGSELRNGRFKVNSFVHASEVSSVGLVWEGRDRKKGNMRVAIKTPKAPSTPSDWPSNWIKELKGLMTFSKLVHPNIMKVYGVYDEKCPAGSGFGKAGQHIPYIILEHCPCTDLFSFLEARGALPMRLARHYFLQLLNGVDYIHDKSASHRDIKPDNIMLDKYLTLKIMILALHERVTKKRASSPSSSQSSGRPSTARLTSTSTRPAPTLEESSTTRAHRISGRVA